MFDGVDEIENVDDTLPDGVPVDDGDTPDDTEFAPLLVVEGVIDDVIEVDRVKELIAVDVAEPVTLDDGDDARETEVVGEMSFEPEGDPEKDTDTDVDEDADGDDVVDDVGETDALPDIEGVWLSEMVEDVEAETQYDAEVEKVTELDGVDVRDEASVEDGDIELLRVVQPLTVPLFPAEKVRDSRGDEDITAVAFTVGEITGERDIEMVIVAVTDDVSNEDAVFDTLDDDVPESAGDCVLEGDVEPERESAIDDGDTETVVDEDADGERDMESVPVFDALVVGLIDDVKVTLLVAEKFVDLEPKRDAVGLSVVVTDVDAVVDMVGLKLDDTDSDDEDVPKPAVALLATLGDELLDDRTVAEPHTLAVEVTLGLGEIVFPTDDVGVVVGDTDVDGVTTRTVPECVGDRDTAAFAMVEETVPVMVPATVTVIVPDKVGENDTVYVGDVLAVVDDEIEGEALVVPAKLPELEMDGDPVGDSTGLADVVVDGDTVVVVDGVKVTEDDALSVLDVLEQTVTVDDVDALTVAAIVGEWLEDELVDPDTLVVCAVDGVTDNDAEELVCPEPESVTRLDTDNDATPVADLLHIPDAEADAVDEGDMVDAADREVEATSDADCDGDALTDAVVVVEMDAEVEGVNKVDAETFGEFELDAETDDDAVTVPLTVGVTDTMTLSVWDTDIEIVEVKLGVADDVDEVDCVGVVDGL